ncbi:DUF3306 domain-containing protein [Methyloversatilis discipulorum]|uniref:DUF3306 domain-containing protein n=1 Tax=Methyloversatilis discipulorum TaxID=1119528 RepID=UPI0026EA119B|nr:DUF3306 domain-containing protein [Methyloversatilis discipulorum]
MNVSDDPVKSFLGRWSRLKREAAAAEPLPLVEVPVAIVPPQTPAVGQAEPDTDVPAEPPPLESLGFDSDYRAFLGQKVDEGLKRAALKKLFHTPHFNTMDGLDVYIEDFNLYEPLPASMVSQLAHAKETLNPTLPDNWLTSVPDETPPAVPETTTAPAEQAAAPALDSPADEDDGVAIEPDNIERLPSELPVSSDSAESNSRSE